MFECMLQPEPRLNSVTKSFAPGDLYPVRDYSLTSAPSQIYDDYTNEKFAFIRSAMRQARDDINMQEYKPRGIRPTVHARNLSSWRQFEDSKMLCPMPLDTSRAGLERPRIRGQPGLQTRLLQDEPHNFGYRATYSRYTKGDPDYFDFDLQSSVDRYKAMRNYYPQTSPNYHEAKLLRDLAHHSGEKYIAPHIMTSGAYPDWRSQKGSVLAGALSSPTFWAHRFERLSEAGNSTKP